MPHEPTVPRSVLVFAGHRVDAPGRAVPRFPPAKLAAVTAAIESRLDALGAGSGDQAFTQGASGGDLIFAEACIGRGVRLQLVQPLTEEEFIRNSVLPSADGVQWAERYRAVRTRCTTPPLTLPVQAGADASYASVFARCNLWMLEQALTWGAHKLTLVCLWDGAYGDGPGGTGNLVDLIRGRGGRVSWIDIRVL